MERFSVVSMAAGILALSLALAASPARAGQEGQAPAGQAKMDLPPAVAQAVKASCPGAAIDKVEVEKEAGVVLYDIEFKADRGEIEVAADGTVMDIATIVAMKDLPAPAAAAIQKAAASATIKQVEKSEIRAEVVEKGGTGTIVKLAVPKCVYEAELVQGAKRGEVQVAPDGKIVEGPKWGSGEAKEKEEMTKKEEAREKDEAEENEEKKEAKPATVDLKVLPPTVLAAFKASYPKAVIRGASKETEKGVTHYEVESVDGKTNRDLLYTADGKAAEIEETIDPESLPAAVRQTLAREFPGSKILKAEDVTKDGKKLFELRIQLKDKKMGVMIDPSGKRIR